METHGNVIRNVPGRDGRRRADRRLNFMMSWWLRRAALIPAGSRVILVPDGCLHELNFETLRVSSGGATLLD